MKILYLLIVLLSTFLFSKDYLEYHENGQIKTLGTLENEVEEGKWYEYYGSGQLKYHGYYKNGKQDGFWRGYFETGEIMFEGFCKDGKMEKSWFGYFKNGQISEITKFSNGKLNGESVEYHRTGNVMTKGEYIDDIKYGFWFDYFDNGQIWLEYYYIDFTEFVVVINSWDQDGNILIEDGKGLYIDYYDNGNKFSEGVFDKGIPNGTWTYYDKGGNIKKVEYYQDGELIEK